LSRHRVLRWLGWTVLALVFILYVGFPVAMAIVAVWPANSQAGPPPEGFKAVTLTTDDGVELAGWYAPTSNGAAVIVVHGAGSSRKAMKRQAAMLAEEGYGVLSLDLRGHGESGGRMNRLGWQGTRDIAAAVAFLGRQEGVERIGALGYSMGGEVVLGALGECPQIVAAVADGATRRSTQELVALPSERSIVRSFTARFMYLVVQLVSWTTPPPPLLQEMKRADAASLLFVASGDEDLEVAFGELFVSELGKRAELWVVPGVPHTGAYAADPGEYSRKVLGFFDEHLLVTGTAP